MKGYQVGDTPVAPDGPVRRSGCATAPVSLADGLARFGARTALVTPGGDEISYERLSALVDEAADRLPSRRLLAIAMRADLAPVVDYLAALRRRFPVVLLTAAPDRAGTAIAELYRPWLVGTPAASALPVPDDCHPELAVLLSTSGSTGSPKLVRLSHRNIVANARAIADYLAIDPADRAIISLPLHYSYGLSVLNSHLAAGASVVLTDASPTDPEFWRLLAGHGVTSLAGVPYSYELYEQAGLRGRTLPALRTLTQAGGRLPPELVRRYADWSAATGRRFFVMYGATEATARMAYLPPELAATRSECIGRAIPGGHLELADVDPATGVGELVYRGPNVMMGYATTRADLARPAELDHYATGDLACREPDGLFRVVGRLSRFSKLFGLRVSHDEIERQLAEQGLSVAVAGDDRRLVLRPLEPVAQDLAALVGTRYGLPPAALLVLAPGPLPRLATGKPDYAQLLREAEALPAATPRAGNVEALFADTFADKVIAPTDSFASLGGDSLSYVNFAIGLETLLPRVPDNWAELSVAQLGALSAAAPARRSVGWVAVDADIAVRAVAITTVVALHAGIGHRFDAGLAGGSTILIALFGMNLWRFQRGHLCGGAAASVLGTFGIRVMLPYLAILAAYAFYKPVDLASALLVSNYVGRFGSALEPFWFLEAIWQSLVAVCLLFALPPVRRFCVARPVAFAALLVAGACAVKLAGALLLDQPALQHRSFDAVFVYVALGWAAAVATTGPQRAAVLAITLAVTAASWGLFNSHVAWMAAGLALVLFVRRLSLPRPVARAVVAIASASFYIYLVHIFVIAALPAGAAWLAIVIALLAGLTVNAAARRWQPGRPAAPIVKAAA